MFDETRADIVTEGVHTDTGCSLSLFMCGYMDVNAGCRLWAVCSHRAAVLAVLWSGSQPLTHTLLTGGFGPCLGIAWAAVLPIIRFS